MSIENQVVLLQERLKSLRSDYTSEVNELTSSPKCYLKRHLKMSATEEKCLEKYPDAFLKGLVNTVQLGIENNWTIDIDLEGGANSTSRHRDPTSVKWSASANLQTQTVSVSVTKTF